MLFRSAGFPLYGHELAGDLDVTPTEAGYGMFVKRHKPFFIGRKPYLEREATCCQRVVRFAMTAAGVRVVKPGSLVVSAKGQYQGKVTSCTLVGERQVGLALVEVTKQPKAGTRVSLFVPPREGTFPEEKQKTQLEPGDNVAVPETAEVLPRFM